jgi:hypothetical protein
MGESTPPWACSPHSHGVAAVPEFRDSIAHPQWRELLAITSLWLAFCGISWWAFPVYPTEAETMLGRKVTCPKMGITEPRFVVGRASMLSGKRLYALSEDLRSDDHVQWVSEGDVLLAPLEGADVPADGSDYREG